MLILSLPLYHVYVSYLSCLLFLSNWVPARSVLLANCYISHFHSSYLHIFLVMLIKEFSCIDQTFMFIFSLYCVCQLCCFLFLCWNNFSIFYNCGVLEPICSPLWCVCFPSGDLANGKYNLFNLQHFKFHLFLCSAFSNNLILKN